MKNRFLSRGLMALLLLWHCANAQTGIVHAEYFYDTDPGVGRGTAITIASPADTVNLNLSVPTTGLGTGFHNLFVRFQSDSGTWGLYEGREFYTLPAGGITNTAHLNGAEYFFDTDPGIGNGTPITVSPATDTANLNLNISTSGLPSGFHFLFIRFRYNNGNWGLYEGRAFYTLPSGNINNTASINSAEYFFDTDPGIGNGIPITVPSATDSANLNLNISTSGLASGFHFLFIRFRYNNGNWGLYEGRAFYALPSGNINNTASINSAEYFFDTDPGIGSGTPITVPSATDSANLNLNISTNGLASGFHFLFIRFRYNNGNWGLYEGRAFYTLPSGNINNTASINSAEYFFDTDPGIGGGTAITVPSATDSANLNLNISTNGLASGFHFLFIRFRYNNGNWGLYEGRAFYTLPSGSLANTAHINSAEYFFDTDPGIGSGTAITVPSATDSANLNLNISTNGLASGFHFLFIRFRYNNGNWGLYEGRAFYTLPGGSFANTAHINRAEYFYDTDPGVGNGTAVAIAVPADTVNLNLLLSVNGLGVGMHSLFIRLRYDNGTWGLFEGRSFYVLPDGIVNTAHINRAEYFFDTDPGVGNGTPVNVTPSTDTANLLLSTISTNGLPRGTHNLFFRFRYDNGTWGLYEGRQFHNCNPPTDTITANGPIIFCIGDSVKLSSNTSNIFTYQWQLNGLSITGAKTSNYTVHDSSGNYTIMITDTSGCFNISNIIGITVGHPVTYNYSATICSGSSFQFGSKTLDTAGVYHQTLLSSAGCDSTVNLTLSLSNSLSSGFTATICQGGSYFFNGKNLTLAGPYRDTLQSAGGCDSIVTLTLQVSQPTITNLNAAICAGGSYNFNGKTLTAANTYTDTLTNVLGCDSFVVLKLTVNPPASTNLFAGICTGGSYPFKGGQLTSTGTYYDTLPASNGCDSIVTLHLQVNSLITNNISASICQGASYPFNGQNLTAPGTYPDSLTATGGCDSIVILTLTVNPLPTVSFNALNDTTFCSTAPVFTLTGGTPTGGKYSVDGTLATSFNPAAAGFGTHIITYTYSDTNSCINSASDTIAVAACTGLNETEAARSVSLYPNPAMEMVVAESKLFAGNLQPKVYDAGGKLVEVSYKQQNGQVVFNTAPLASGLYSVQFNISGEVVNKRFMKVE